MTPQDLYERIVRHHRRTGAPPKTLSLTHEQYASLCMNTPMRSGLLQPRDYRRRRRPLFDGIPIRLRRS